MSVSAPAPRAPKPSPCLRQLIGMVMVMWAFGLGPLFALMLVPGRTGEIKHSRMTGAEAQEYLETKLAADPRRLAAYQKAVDRLKAKGKTRSAVVVARAYSEEVPQTALRRIAEVFVPTLYAPVAAILE